MLASFAVYSASGSSASSSFSTAAPSITISTATPVATASLQSDLPSQAPDPPKQDWCPSEIFCAGPLLQTVNIAHLFADDKTFADKASPTSKSPQDVLAQFKNISSNDVTYDEIINFVENFFAGEGLELEALALPNFVQTPSFLGNVSDPLLKAWSQTVHGFWTQLIRGTNSSTLCGAGKDCESSLIPLNHTFVVPGGRFREQYYWDSFWIVEGLIESQLFDIVNATLQNFMDELDNFGFIPNGGRIYYLDRSQPPLFIQMLSRYVTASGDKSILQRALPLAEKELKWWDDERTINITSPFSNKTFQMHRYDVNNSAPRPESYFTDYTTANVPSGLNESQRSDLYAELATGAETGWDYTVRWYNRDDNGTNGLRGLQVRSTIPVDLNSILYKNHVLMASLYGSSNSSAADRHRSTAASIKEGILDLFWDSQKLAFYDFNLKVNDRNNIFTAANFYPYWSGIVPDEVLSSAESAFGAFSSVNLVVNRYNGTFPTTFIDSGLQWDAPNAWPPHQYIIIQALRALPSNITNSSLPTAPSNQSTFGLIPNGQLGLSEADLPGQPLLVTASSINATKTGPDADINKLNGTGWAQALERQLANRYFASALCSWHATGGSIPGILPRLSDAELQVTQSVNNTGNMFEKFSNLDIDSAGSGGEYTVQAGFGWTNGVVLWVASNYGNVLVAPQCPDLLQVTSSGGSGNGSMAGQGSQGGNGQNNSNDAMKVTTQTLGMLGIAAIGLLLL
ncbi:glycoside hydrolase family 37 protein [Cyathus striatus]|nr:glycoside hydrolase family 37 protein [Cyathus striatus]